MQTQAKFCVCFTKIDTNFFSRLPLTPKVGPPPSTEILFL